MLEYAMYTLTAICIVTLPFPIDLYLRRREVRYLSLLASGWLLLAVSPLLYLAAASTSHPWGALFASTMLAAVMLLVAGGLSYFVELPPIRTAGAIVLFCAALLPLFILIPSTQALTMLGQAVALGGSAGLGVVKRKKFMLVGGQSYYWLVGVLSIGALAAFAWIGSMDSVTGTAPVAPWIGTTAAVVLAALFLVVLEHSTALEELGRQNRELEAYRGGLELLVAKRTADLESANRTKDQFLSAMSHELRTPLNSIIGFSGILEQGLAGPLSEEQRKQVGMISGSGKHLLGLVNQILDLAKIESGKVVLNPAPLKIDEVIESLTDTIRPLSDEKGLELTTSLDDSPTEVITDRTRLEQILLNLLSNAVKFTNEGGVNVGVTFPGNMMRIVVSDTGRGIPRTDLDKVFEEFYQGKDPAGGNVSGTGLGLAISARLAQMLGGSLAAESAPGEGSVFTLELPRARQADGSRAREGVRHHGRSNH